jgi:nitrogen-specific signal transduction histidine kinase/CheY-like chemotaxis protein
MVAVAITASPIRDDTGEVVAISATARDISERREAERAERANRAKNEFLSRMSHELRTPLNAVLGFGQLLSLRENDPKTQEEVDHILSAGRHLLELVDETLEISTIESGAVELAIEPVDAAAAVDEAVGLLQLAGAARRICVEVDRPSLAAPVCADRQRLKQVLLNLVSNAIKFNVDGGRVVIRGERRDSGRFAIAVADSGRGIAPADVPKLFSPFERLDAAEAGIEGSGLGLALSRRLATAMGGGIDVDSEPGRGSTFTVTLELADAAATGHGERNGAGDGVEGAPAGADADRHVVLCVEDNLSNLDLIERIFARRGDVELVTAVEGRLGLELARERKPDVVLLDLDLPDLPGEEVLTRLRSDPSTRDVPVIVVSADATSAQIEGLTELGADAYVTKPIDVRRLMALLDETIAPPVPA